MRYRKLVSSSIGVLAVVALGAASGLAPADAAPKKGGGGGGPVDLHGKDTTAPSLTVPANITTAATVQFGAAVTFTVTATDDKDPAPVVVSSKQSGSTFPVGTTTVTVKATDWKGNTATKSFKVTVTPYSGGDVHYQAYSSDWDGQIYFVWDITVAADGTVAGTGRQDAGINFYDDLVNGPLPEGLSGAGVVSGTIASNASCQVTSSRNFWYSTENSRYAAWVPTYVEDVGGFSGSTTASVDTAGNIFFTTDPLDQPPDFWSGGNYWMRQ